MNIAGKAPPSELLKFPLTDTRQRHVVDFELHTWATFDAGVRQWQSE
jgi:hypothetical protein